MTIYRATPMREKICFPPDGHPYDAPPTEPRTDCNPLASKIFTWGTLIVVGGAAGWTLFYFAVTFAIALLWYL